MKHYIFIIFLAITLNNGVNNSLFAQQFDSTLNVYKIAKNNYTYFKLPYDYKRNYRYYKNHKYNPWGDYDNSFLKDSLSDGVYKVFLDSTLSLIMYETTIKNYKKNGNYIIYYPNGRIKQSSFYYNDTLDGKIFSYNHLGELNSTAEYKMGKLISPPTFIGTTNYSNHIHGIDAIDYYISQKKGFNSIYNNDLPICNITNMGILNSYLEIGSRKDSIVKYDKYGTMLEKTFYEQYISKNGKIEYREKWKKNNNIEKYSREWFNINSNESIIHSLSIENNERPNYLDYNNDFIFIYKLNKIKEYKNLSDLYIKVSYYDDDIYKSYYDSLIQSLNGLENLQLLETIRIESSGLSKIPENVYLCKNLKTLVISSSIDLNVISNNITKLTKLENLILEYPKGNLDSLILKLQYLPNLKFLYILCSRIDTTITLLPKLQNLQILILEVYSTPKYYLNIEEIKQMKNLKYLASPSITPDFYNLYKEYPNLYISRYDDDYCFVKGTPIILSSNKIKPIEMLQIGDILLSYDETTNQIDTTVVTKLFHHTNNTFSCMSIQIEVNKKIIEVICTSIHPFYTKVRGYIQAGELTNNDYLFYLNPQTNKYEYFKITKIVELPNKVSEVFNIETSKHNYFANGILVHNK